MTTGYSHPFYAQSLNEFGTPRFLSESGGWILERRVANSDKLDAMGCYPLFTCVDWAKLHNDLEQLKSDLVSLAIVADPFGEYDLDYLRKCFPDLVAPFKQHLVTDLSHSPETFVNAHHRRNARKALERLTVEHCPDPLLFADDWIKLYANLVKRHDVRGLACFSPNSLRAQLAVPGIHMFRATHQQETAGITLWYTNGPVAYYHLGAYSDTGYDMGASFALFWRVIEYFSNFGLAWLDLGSGPGLASQSPDDGLTRFKRGWSNDTRTAYFCGRILDQQGYVELMSNKPNDSGYFPGYRNGEFG